ncbi:AN1-type zinc finger protein 4 isoform X1 [Pezoporus wallicus]|uniref:AN1-type zinc finger protein 4 isoform X1 n=1 Tax=Pezoporus wallicus TaxID=35540 RepID=UPI0025506D31|nr:AN1-type zinc finger protein 4 isoform X1 [Pezoporus wallicus]XP_057257060.1 AN1-type zinc finger protein 4 isoform X1 [Pezoporus wallicus]XP_057257061.1 AN1-type zinc finger protein 4 isoform X1 [Pezoporus wallicus]XP_057257062.1 AN1-type zinc finger protein 4 isoform X1 [Pezoporus wallicus]XP_061315267.1 AN1-type zinc finger protein 4 isoform X1 [Pezoporus flaviventris]XP_061315268.1 AN1-type zinc finger protein 4 isoform X1 [Pezoporus flaviventris]XP_061315269.1 AN1-type zinc finger pro
MANKKKPSFFNEDNMGPFHYKLPFYETMELFIETLTGTCFELRVSPFETVISVKAKIQRLEGIPVSQQHLIWNNTELRDDYCLNDYNISEGCTLKLVLAMRGGPINTRRVSVEDPIREMAEYMDPTRDEIWEKGASNKQVTFLVYREGDQLNFFRVVDRGDGTLTPLSESLGGGSIYNLYADDEDETEASPSGQQIIENSITMNKMKLLKAKMENMNLSKKPKKTVKVKSRPPVAPRPSSGSVAAARHRFLRVLPHIGQSCLPPPGNSYHSESSQNALSALATLATAGRTMPSAANDFLKEDDTWQSDSWSQPLSSIRLPPKISRVELENAKLPTNSILTPVSSPCENSEKASENVTSASEEDAVLFPNLTNIELYETEEKLLPETDTFALLTEESTTEQCSEIYDIGKVNQELELPDGDEESKVVEQHRKPISKVLSTTAVGSGLLHTHELSPQKNLLLSPLRYSAQMARHSSLKPQAQPKCFEAGNLRSTASPNMLRSLEVRSLADSSFSRTARFCSMKVESLGKRPDVVSKAEARDITDVADKASREAVNSVTNLGFLASLARSTNRESIQSSCGTGRFWTSGIALPANLQHCQEESFRKATSPNEAAEYILSAHGLGMNGSIAAVGRRVAGEATHLPPVNGSIQVKKKITKHCFLCGKKTGLATTYECRCGNIFCATHRYAETHTCTYDYKSAGRRYLQETNPVVSAPKLPKI